MICELWHNGTPDYRIGVVDAEPEPGAVLVCDECMGTFDTWYGCECGWNRWVVYVDSPRTDEWPGCIIYPPRTPENRSPGVPRPCELPRPCFAPHLFFFLWAILLGVAGWILAS